jgi:hypothetical protein
MCSTSPLGYVRAALARLSSGVAASTPETRAMIPTQGVTDSPPLDALPVERAFALLEELIRQADPASLAAAYVLTRLLVSRRCLKYLDQAIVHGERNLTYEHPQSKRKFTIKDQALGDDDISAVRHEVLARLGCADPNANPLPGASIPQTASSGQRLAVPAGSAPKTSAVGSRLKAAALAVMSSKSRARAAIKAALPRDCKPLTDAATKEIYRRNGFRITGLAADASIRDITRHTDRLKLMEDLGQTAGRHGGAFALATPPSLEQLRDAVHRLKDPEQRLIDEFFWFWPEKFGESQSDTALRALESGDVEAAGRIWTEKEGDNQTASTAAHNLAVMHHMAALDTELQVLSKEPQPEAPGMSGVESRWRESFKRWERVVSDDNLWNQVVHRIDSLQDPRLTADFAQGMRHSLPEALDQINAELALAHAEAGRVDHARLHVRFMRETNQGLDNVEKTSELVLTPATKRLKEQIRRTVHEAEKEPRNGAAAAHELLEQALRSVVLFDLFFGKDNQVRNELFDTVAQACNNLSAGFFKATEDEKTSLELLRAALPLATSIQLRQEIEKNIRTLRGLAASAALKPIYAQLKRIQDSKESPESLLRQTESEILPLLKEAQSNKREDGETLEQLENTIVIVLRSISIRAHNEKHDFQTAFDATALALKHCCDPALRKQLTEDRKAIEDSRATTLCYYCGAGSADPGSAAKVSMYGIVQVIGNRVSYRTASLEIQRCQRCRWKNTLSPIATAAGALGGLALYIGLLSSGIVSYQNVAQGVRDLLVVGLLFAAALPAVLLRTLVQRILGGKSRSDVRAHPAVRKLLQEGWHLGLKPPNVR